MKGDEGKIEWWGKRLILSLYLPLIGSFLWVLSADLAHREEAQSRADSYAAAAGQRIESICLRRQTSRLVAQCVQETDKASREDQRREQEVSDQQVTANQTSYLSFLALVGLFVSSAGIWAVWRSIKQGQKTYQAFVAVEDASLVVEFSAGNQMEIFHDGEKQPDSYFLPMVITNIGRSTARIHGWSAGTETYRHDHTLKAGDTWDGLEHLELREPTKNFVVSIHYSSPVRERMVLEVKAALRLRKLLNGGTSVTARVKSARLRPEQEGGKK